MENKDKFYINPVLLEMLDDIFSANKLIYQSKNSIEYIRGCRDVIGKLKELTKTVPKDTLIIEEGELM